MIRFDNTEVFNIEGALRGMRNPLNSWDKSDSVYLSSNAKDAVVGLNDLDLAQRLIKSGSDHRKFLRQIMVSVDITAPLYWWKEFDTYKVATTSNSCSTMHTIHKKEFELDDFSVEYIEDDIEYIITNLNYYRNSYNDYDKFVKDLEYIGFKKDEIPTRKSLWYAMIQLLPSSYNQKRTITLNYETLRNIYFSRKNHKLDEWSVGFVCWIESLPYAKEFILYQ